MQETLKNKDNLVKFSLAVLLIATAVLFRLVPHPANFAPIAAIAIFGGAILPRKWALSLPLLAMIASDAVLGFHSLILFTWGSFLVIALLSTFYMTKIKPSRIVASSVAASVIFFLVTNFGVWLEGRLYPLTADGLFNSYVNAIPFFRNTLVSDLFFSAVLFGSYALVYRVAFNKSGSLKLSATS